ncbi:MAG TPA: phage holin family protein, partial [Microthrixaceae bacterium]|nr:phage holin family protein [Microthrixaceae bacterium]
SAGQNSGGSSAGANNATGANPSSRNVDPDWTDQVTNLVVDTVDSVRDRTTGRILEYARASVNAVVAVILAIPVMVLFVVFLVRLLTWAVGRAWLSYTIVGTLLVLVGVVLWSRRSKLPI